MLQKWIDDDGVLEFISNISSKNGFFTEKKIFKNERKRYANYEM